LYLKPDQLSDWSKGAQEARILLVLKLGRYVWLQVRTHKLSVMLLSIIWGKNFVPLAVGLIPLMSYMGKVLSGCVPQSVRLA
jgi:hypothetical protein